MARELAGFRLWARILGVMFTLGSLMVPAALAQQHSIYATIVGDVTDSSAAVVPGAKVTATNTATGIGVSTMTDANGYYQITRLVQGPYRVMAERPGFKAFVRLGLTLSESQTIRVDAVLQPGEVKQTITVRASTPLINSESAQLGGQITWNDRKYLPTANPNFFSTIGLYAGAVSAHPGYFVSFAGSSMTQYDYSVDGQTFNDPYSGHNATIGMYDEWMHDQSVSYMNNSAEYSTPVVVNASTKSGTNQLHGSAVWYYSSGGLNGRNPFSPTKPPEVHQMVSGGVGGPIRKDKAFFYASYFADRDHTSKTYVDTVPTAAMRQGDFSEVTTPIIDPFTGEAFQSNQIPSTMISPVATQFLNKFYPLPNFGGSGYQGGNYRATQKQAVGADAFVGRVDYRLSNRHMVFVRYTYGEGGEGGQFTGSVPNVGPRLGYRRDQNVTINDTFSFTPAIFNEFSIGGSRDHNLIIPSTTYGPDQSGLVGTNPPVPAMPQFNIAGFTTASQQDHYDTVGETWTIRDNVSWVRGRQRLQTGFLFLRGNNDASFGGGSRVLGVFGFQNNWPTKNATFNALPNFLLGLPRTEFRYAPGSWIGRDYLSRNSYEGFVQDDLQINPKLTLNMGLRYGYYTPWSEKLGRLGTFNPHTQDMVVPNSLSLKSMNPGIFVSYPTLVVTANQAGYPTTIVNYSEANFDPRIGFAYRLGQNTVIRSGYGIFHDFEPPTTTVADSLAFFLAFQYFPANTITNGVPSYQFPDPFSIASFQGVGTLELSGTPKNLKVPTVQQWSFTVEHQFPRSTAMRLSYVATRATDQLYSYDLNLPAFVPGGTPLNQGLTQSDRPYPIYGPITWLQNGAGAFYNGFMVEVTHRSGGFWFDSHYTWAHDLGTSEGGNALDLGVSAYNPFDRQQDYGNISFQARHRWVTMYDYQLPVGQGHWLGSKMPGWANRALGGWQVTGIFTVSSGDWLTPSYCGYDPVGSPNNEFFCGRPDRLANGNLASGQRNQYRWFDTSAFAIPGASSSSPLTPPNDYIGRLGNSSRSIIEGPGWWQYDMGLMKGFTFRERWHVHMFALATNLFNHPNLGNPNMDISIPRTAGEILGIRNDGNASGIGMRLIRLGVRIEF